MPIGYRHVGVLLAVAALLTSGVTLAATSQTAPAQLEQGEQPASFDVANMSAPTSLAPTESADVTANVTNPGNETSTQLVSMRVDGEVRERVSLRLAPNETVTVSFTLNSSELGENTNFVGVYTRDYGEVVRVQLAQSFDVADLNAPDNATVGDVVAVSANVTNPNSFNDTQRVEYRLDGDVVATTALQLGPNATETVTFSLDTGQLAAGAYTHSVFTLDHGVVGEITLTEAQEPPETTTTETTTQNETATETTATETTMETTTMETTTMETTTETTATETTMETTTVETTTQNETATETTTETTAQNETTTETTG